MNHNHTHHAPELVGAFSYPEENVNDYSGYDDGFWEPSDGPCAPEPDPCQYCSVMSGALKECDKTCETLTEERWIDLTKDRK